MKINAADNLENMLIKTILLANSCIACTCPVLIGEIAPDREIGSDRVPISFNVMCLIGFNPRGDLLQCLESDSCATI